MKKNIILVPFVALGLMFTSCESQLDIPQKSVMDLTTYYETAGEAEVATLVARLHKQYFTGVQGYEVICGLDILSDDFHAGGGGGTDNASQMRDMAAYIMTSQDDIPKAVYTGIYKEVYYCNLIVEKLKDRTEDYAKRAVAEAKFFRAISMFEAVRWWENPPFVDHVLADNEYHTPNGDPETIIRWCLTNLDEAIADLKSTTIDHKAFGAYVSKEAAKAYKGKIALWYGQKYDNAEILAMAKQPLLDVINSNAFGLVEDMSIIGRNAGDFCKEYIFEHNSADNDGFVDWNQSDLRHTYIGLRVENLALPAHIQRGGWGWTGVTGDFGKFLTKHEGGTEGKRFKAWIATYDQLLGMNYATGVTPGVVGKYPDNEGYFRMKNIFYADDVFPSNGFWKMSKANWFYMRYAEVLLLYAEYCLESGESKADGLARLNEVRQRAGLAPATELTDQVLRDERRAELFGESERYFDLVRWGEAPTKLADKGKKYYSLKGYKAGVTPGGPDSWDILVEDGPGSGWQDKYKHLPFPFTQVQANDNLRQHDGW